MDCDTYREWMSLWLDQRLTQDEIRQVEAHTATCPTCHAVLDGMRQVDRLLTAAPMMAPAPGFTLRFQTRLAARRRRRRTWAGLVILALATLTLSLVIVALLAASGLALWESLAISGVLVEGIGVLLDLGKAWVTLLKLTWLVLSALSRGLRHPIFIAYVVATAILTAAWTQVVARRSFSQLRISNSRLEARGGIR